MSTFKQHHHHHHYCYYFYWTMIYETVNFQSILSLNVDNVSFAILFWTFLFVNICNICLLASTLMFFFILQFIKQLFSFQFTILHYKLIELEIVFFSSVSFSFFLDRNSITTLLHHIIMRQFDQHIFHKTDGCLEKWWAGEKFSTLSIKYNIFSGKELCKCVCVCVIKSKSTKKR